MRVGLGCTSGQPSKPNYCLSTHARSFFMSVVNLKDLKQEFYDFLGSLSVEEVTENIDLIREVERFDRLMQAAEGN
ncbi:MAG: hypothetical protein EA369_09495 [Bradymonadales bacterium]|nr:MAG: hypothetical protein EA369_09495 [Bradymonadales bacterium]